MITSLRCNGVTVQRCLVVLMLIAAPLAAQQPGPPGRPQPRGAGGMPGGDMGQRERQMPGPPMPGGMNRDPIMSNLFSPEMIMQNQEAINLTEEQRNAMMQDMQTTQQSAQQIQWRLQAAIERLSTVLRDARPNEAAAMAALDSVLSTEREMKRSQIGLLVRLKSRLTPEQQAFLRGRTMRGED